MATTRPTWREAWPWLAAALPWLVLVNYLRLEWSANAQYAYGFVVPFLVLYLVAQRWPDRPAVTAPVRHPALLVLVVPLALLLLPLLLLAEASPEWRLIGLGLALVTLSLTACLILWRGGWATLRHFAFPLLFTLVAVPWPTSLEFKVILPLMQHDAATSVEILNWYGLPAVQRQNIIDLPNGSVGVDEACSGIRSLQTSLMIALFVGAWLRLSLLRRLVLLAAALALTYALNVVRTLLLVALSARSGEHGLEHWHDFAGLGILVLTLVGLWGLARLLSPKPPVIPAPPPMPPTPAPAAPWPRAALLVLAAWFILAVAGTQLWFGLHGKNEPPVARWTIHWPSQLLTYEPVEIPEDARSTFFSASDESSAARWQEPDHPSLWLGYFIKWEAGRETSILASTHHPDVCLPAAGKNLVADYGVTTFHAAGIDLPAELYQFDDAGQPLFVLYCVWSNGGIRKLADPPPWLESIRRNFLPLTPAPALAYRIQAIAQGQRNQGQQILELGLWGPANIDDARTLFGEEVTRLVVATPR